jgi:thiol-disulfide isomerase/thioredoxin
LRLFTLAVTSLTGIQSSLMPDPRFSLICLALASALLAGVPGTDARAAAAGDAAPGFSIPDARGAAVSLEALRGKVVYLDFWASWCGPCRRSFPWMNELVQRYAAQGLAVIAVNVDKKAADANQFLQQNPARFTVLYDPAGAAPLAYGVKGMPSSYLIDREGKVVRVEAGFFDEHKPAIEEAVRVLLQKRKTDS